MVLLHWNTLTAYRIFLKYILLFCLKKCFSLTFGKGFVIGELVMKRNDWKKQSVCSGTEALIFNGHYDQGKIQGLGFRYYS